MNQNDGLADSIRVKTKCENCKATHTIELFEGECVSGFIVGCDKCNKHISKHDINLDDSDEL